MSSERLPTRDYVASALVALIILAYFGHLVWEQVPFVQDARGMAALGVAVGHSAFIIIRGSGILYVTGLAEMGLALMSLLLGLTTLILSHTAIAETFLAVFIASIVVVWVIELMDHTGILPSHHGGRASS